MTFTFRTSKGTGTVDLSKKGHSLKNFNVTATIEGQEFEAAIYTQELKGTTTATLRVNLLVLNKLNLLNAPKQDMIVDIIIEGESSLRTVLAKLNDKKPTKKIKGKFYNGTFWSDEAVSKMSYSEQVICGIYSE